MVEARAVKSRQLFVLRGPGFGVRWSGVQSQFLHLSLVELRQVTGLAESHFNHLCHEDHKNQSASWSYCEGLMGSCMERAQTALVMY